MLRKDYERLIKLQDEFEKLEGHEDDPEIAKRIAEIQQEAEEIDMMIQTELF